MEEIAIVFKMPKKISNKREQKMLDDAWKNKVKERDSWTCQVCKNKVIGHNCQAHHIIPKGYKLTRWDINNGITLCYRCHKVDLNSAHMNAIWFYCWFKSKKLAQFRYIIKKLKEIDEQK
jgi:5-methylcytosine-specific restriction endonuclease McrA